jgi:hypothetical protein
MEEITSLRIGFLSICCVSSARGNSLYQKRRKVTREDDDYFIFIQVGFVFFAPYEGRFVFFAPENFELHANNRLIVWSHKI